MSFDNFEGEQSHDSPCDDKSNDFLEDVEQEMYRSEIEAVLSNLKPECYSISFWQWKPLSWALLDKQMQVHVVVLHVEIMNNY